MRVERRRKSFTQLRERNMSAKTPQISRPAKIVSPEEKNGLGAPTQDGNSVLSFPTRDLINNSNGQFLCILYIFVVPMGISHMKNLGRFPQGWPAATKSRYSTLINSKVHAGSFPASKKVIYICVKIE